MFMGFSMVTQFIHIVQKLEADVQNLNIGDDRVIKSISWTLIESIHGKSDKFEFSMTKQNDTFRIETTNLANFWSDWSSGTSHQDCCQWSQESDEIHRAESLYAPTGSDINSGNHLLEVDPCTTDSITHLKVFYTDTVTHLQDSFIFRWI